MHFLGTGDKQRSMENNVEHISDALYHRGIRRSTQLYSVFRAGRRYDNNVIGLQHDYRSLISTWVHQYFDTVHHTSGVIS